VRTTLFVVVIVLTAAAWLLTWSTTHNMGLMMQMGVPMSLGMEGWASVASFFTFTGMWLIMMVAMMLPSTYPTLLLHRTVYRKRTPDARGGTFFFGMSYFLVWTTTGIFFYGLYVLIGKLRQMFPGSDLVVLRAAGLALVLAGVYQWSSLKRACLQHCQNPLTFVSEHWHDGNLGALRMGAGHGMYCFFCCWGLMMILFVMGVMHLGWMAAIGALILLEKIIPSGRFIPQVIGAVFVGLGAITTLFPNLLLALSSEILLAY
jgi:predicted metal-binding membrane protein